MSWYETLTIIPEGDSLRRGRGSRGLSGLDPWPEVDSSRSLEEERALKVSRTLSREGGQLYPIPSTGWPLTKAEAMSAQDGHRRRQKECQTPQKVVAHPLPENSRTRGFISGKAKGLCPPPSTRVQGLDSNPKKLEEE